MTHRTRVALTVAAMAIAAPATAQAATGTPTAFDASACSTTPKASAFASVSTLRALNTKESSFGAPRPTGGTAHKKFVRWLDGQLGAIKGVKVRSLSYRIKRWDAKATKLTVGGTSLPVAGPVPYSKSTGAAGTSAPLAYVPPGTDITAANAAGKIVVRELGPGSVPFVVFAPTVLGVGGYDPTGLLTGGGTYTRDFLTPVQPELEAAGKAGAKGILFLRPLPRKQQKDFYAPYEGIVWKVPGAYVGSDESAKIRAQLALGHPVTAKLTIDAKRTPTTTKTLIATIKGRSKQRLVVDSHTDGTNAVEDNGPIAMLAMARYLAKLPASCRAKTVQFVFATGHFYQHLLGPNKVRDGGSEQVAEQLDRDYDKGTVAGVMVLEHLGAYQYDAVKRTDGGPGQQLVRSKRHELSLVGVSPSPALQKATVGVVEKYKLDPTAVIQGADAPDPKVVPHFCSFGGEGSPYERNLLPTVSTIAAPNVLFDPAFGTEAIDFTYMHTQTLAYTDLLLQLSRMSKGAIAGDVTAMRAARKAGTPTCPPN